MRKYPAPKLEYKFVCITSKEAPADLLAGVSCYFNESETYFPIFNFPEIRYAYKENYTFDDDGFIARMIGNEAKVLINNALAKINCDRILLVGLSDIQKGYFNFLPKSIVIFIDGLNEVEEKLAFLKKRFDGEICCRKTEAAKGLILAKSENKRIIFNDTAQVLSNYIRSNEGIIVIESGNDSSDIISINYAHAVSADVLFIESIERSETHNLQKLIHRWKKNRSTDDFKRMARKIRKRIGYFDFSKYEYATFFTEGLPYGVVLNNVIPISHVWRSLREDLLIFNNIIQEDLDLSFGSALIFSPEEFDKEETADIMSLLSQHNFLNKELVGPNATVNNLDSCGNHYPYDILHICSHGGEINGYFVIEEFVDRDGITHKVEYEEVVGFAPNKDEDNDDKLIGVFRKAIFRRFDGHAWMSPELKAQNIAQYIFEDMRKSIFNGEMGKTATRVRANYQIYSSCHIKCFDSIHQGHFRILASHSSPLVFNNTCSSWKEICISIVAAGAKAYIGTLWNIKNQTAVKSAKDFYNNLFGNNILHAFHGMVKQIDLEPDKNIYIFWGLHFSSIKLPESFSKKKVLKELLVSLSRWLQHVNKVKDSEVRKNSLRAAKFIRKVILTEFKPSDLGDIITKIDKQNPEITQNDLENQDFEERGVLDLTMK